MAQLQGRAPQALEAQSAEVLSVAVEQRPVDQMVAPSRAGAPFDDDGRVGGEFVLAAAMDLDDDDERHLGFVENGGVRPNQAQPANHPGGRGPRRCRGR